MNNYLNGDDMWPYVTMWEYEERIIPLQKIVDIFHESCNQKLKCYILTSPLDEERFSVLKAHDNLDFYWVKRLDNQDLNGLVGLFSFREAYSVTGNPSHTNGEQIERTYLLACLSTPLGEGHAHQCLVS